MRRFTRKQKKMLRSMAAGVSCCILLGVTLAVLAIANTRPAVPVRFSDILEGASVTAPAQPDAPAAVTHDPDYLYETMFPAELVTTPASRSVTTTTVPSETETVGAGGTLLFDTTETTAAPETGREPILLPPDDDDPDAASETQEQPVPGTTPAPTSATTTTTTTRAVTTTTTTPATTAHTSKTPFINIGGGVVSDDDSIYIKMLGLVNKARRENGLEKLWYSARVHEVATLRAYELSSYYSHDRPDGKGFYTAFADVGVTYTRAGENIAYGRNMFDTPEEVFRAWMDSESHRENILNPNYECVAFGLSVLKVGNDTYYYWTQEFAAF